jgi:hypothetical protein
MESNGMVVYAKTTSNRKRFAALAVSRLKTARLRKESAE